MNVDSILISDFAAVSEGKLSVVGVFNRIGPVPLPVRLGQIWVSLVIHGHSSEAGREHHGEIRMINAKRERLQTLDFAFQFPGAPDPGMEAVPLRTVHTVGILLPVFTEAGPYAVEVYIDDTYHASASFAVVAAGE